MSLSSESELWEVKPPLKVNTGRWGMGGRQPRSLTWLVLTSCVTLTQWLNLSVPQWPHLETRIVTARAWQSRCENRMRGMQGAQWAPEPLLLTLNTLNSQPGLLFLLQVLALHNWRIGSHSFPVWGKINSEITPILLRDKLTLKKPLCYLSCPVHCRVSLGGFAH